MYWITFCLLTGLVTAAFGADDPPSPLRERFLAAERMIAQDDDTHYFELAEQIRDYPLYPYLQYQWLKKHLDATAAIQQFLTDHADSRYAGLLKRTWLEQLGKRQQWDTFLHYYQSGKDPILQCYAGQAYLHGNHPQPGLEIAKTLWLNGSEQPKECEPLFKALKASPDFTQDMIWQRFYTALQNGKPGLAESLLSDMNADSHKTATTWLAIHRQPQRLLQEENLNSIDSLTGALFRYGIERLAEDHARQAVALWDAEKNRYAIAPPDAALTERKLALELAFKREPDAYQRLTTLPSDDETVREWRIRAALNEQNWNHVAAALTALSPSEKQINRWQYWQARCDIQTGKPELAYPILEKLSRDRSIYGLLAAQKLNRPINWTNTPLQVSPEQLNQLQKQADFQAVAEFRALNRQQEAKLQWWFALSKIEPTRLPIAAKLAQQWQWHPIAIFTLAKTGYWDDLELRFPLAFNDIVANAAAAQRLQPAVVLGLIRQESAFDVEANSPAGAKGLMQIMPATGRLVADELKEIWHGDTDLLNPQTNIRFGSYYYNKLLQQFAGNYALAAAAYNAGVNRVKRWLPFDKAIPADVWLETIPYKETRQYVGSVLTYAMIYRERLKQPGLKIGDLLRDILPG